MSEVKLTVKQIMNLGLWDRVCEFKGWSPWIVNEGQISEDEIVEFDDEFKREVIEERFEYNIGDKFERKNREYEIVGKVRHENRGEHVYMVKVREFGEEEVDYELFDEMAFASYKKIN